jgi:hypothetical protein
MLNFFSFYLARYSEVIGQPIDCQEPRIGFAQQILVVTP